MSIPAIGQVWKKGEDFIYITDGFFQDPVYHRISNYFQWKKIKEDGTLTKKTYSGYADFDEQMQADIKIETTITNIRKK